MKQKLMKYLTLLLLASQICLSQRNLNFLDDYDEEEEEGSNTCFKLENFSNGKNFKIIINSAEWWSTSNVQFSLKNTCSTPQFIENLMVVVDQWKINGNVVNSNLGVSQSGQPWLSIQSPVAKDNKIFVVINTPSCSGQYCDWAKVPANSGHNLMVNTGVSSPITSSTVNSLYIDGGEPPVTTGTLSLSVDSSQISTICQTLCSIKIIVTKNISTLSVLDSFDISPAMNGGKFTKIISNVVAGSYKITVDGATLPTTPNGTISINYNPSNVVDVNSGQVTSASITLNYTKNVEKGNLVIVLNNFPSNFKNSIKGSLLNTANNNKFDLIFTSTQSSVTIQNLEATNTYKILIPGIINPLYLNSILGKIEGSARVTSNQTTTVTLSYKQITEGIHPVNFNFSGYGGDVSMHFSSSNLADLSDYLYQDITLKISDGTNIVLNFLGSETASLKIDNIQGYSTKISNSVINTSIASINVTFTPNTSMKAIGGYYQSWSAAWTGNGASHTLSKIPGYISYILVSFATPSLSYTENSYSFTNTGLQFSSDFSVVKSAIALAHEKNPNQKFLLSVGGATYPWTNPNFKGMVALMNDLGLDGIDIDFEDTPSCQGVDTLNMTCSTDKSLINIIDNLKLLMPQGKLLTAAVFSVGGYGTPAYPNSKFGPVSSYAGMWVNPLKISGSKLDEIFIMSYDASPAYSPTDAFNAYSNIYKGKIHLGLEVPPEAWGGYVLTVPDALKFATYVMENEGDGVFIWSLQKSQGGVSSNTFLKPICLLYGQSGCEVDIPQN